MTNSPFARRRADFFARNDECWHCGQHRTLQQCVWEAQSVRLMAWLCEPCWLAQLRENTEAEAHAALKAAREAQAL